MSKNKFVRATLVAGLMVCAGIFGKHMIASSTTMGTETDMAGMSYTLSQYCSVQLGAKQADPEAIIAFEDQANGQSETVTSGTTISGENNNTESQATAEATPKPESEYANVGISIAADYVNIRKQPNTDATVVGKLYRGSAATIVKTEGEWVYIKSGSVSGYIRKDYLAIGYSAEKLIDDFGTKWATVTTETLRVRSEKNTTSTILSYINEDESFEVLREEDEWVKISLDDANGYVMKDYVKISVQFKKAVSVEEEREEARRKAAAEAAEKAEVKPASTSHSSVSNNTSQNKSSHSSSSSSHKNTSSSSSSSSRRSNENSNGGGGQASHKKPVSSNGGGGQAGRRKTESSNGGGGSAGSSKSSSSNGGGGSALGSGDGSSVASYALNFVGNSYVYGGTSLTHGTDCSGFTMSVYRKFGIRLPRTSREQSRVGKKVSLSNVEAGDLIFYKNGGSVGHVALCIGGGRVVHASNSRVGIVTSSMYYRTPYCARRVLN